MLRVVIFILTAEMWPADIYLLQCRKDVLADGQQPDCEEGGGGGQMSVRDCRFMAPLGK